jgi:Cu-processing system permease protein
MSRVWIIAGFALRESLRKRVFIVVALLTVAFLALYALGVWQISQEIDEIGVVDGVEGDVVAGATLLGLSMFAILFLGAILAVFLTLGAVRGDAERGLLQPLIVRPLTRGTFLLGRYVAAATVCAAYVIVVFLAAVVITNAFIGWWPDRLLVPALELGAGVAVIAALALGGSVVLSSTANGIAVFMLFGAGLVAGLLGQIAEPEALNSETLENVSRTASWVLPFEALYQSALSEITADTVGFTRFAINLGPFGGATSFGALLVPFTVAYVAAIGAAALWAFRRRDL